MVSHTCSLPFLCWHQSSNRLWKIVAYLLFAGFVFVCLSILSDSLSSPVSEWHLHRHESCCLPFQTIHHSGLINTFSLSLSPPALSLSCPPPLHLHHFATSFVRSSVCIEAWVQCMRCVYICSYHNTPFNYMHDAVTYLLTSTISASPSFRRLAFHWSKTGPKSYWLLTLLARLSRSWLQLILSHFHHCESCKTG